MKPVLYSFRRCPYAIRARMALNYAGVEMELREILLRDKPPSMLKASAKGTVPVMLLPDGTVIDESIDVMHWALAQQQHLVNKRLGFADVAIFPFVRQFAFVDKTWFDQAPYPFLQSWLCSFLDSALFMNVMTKYPTWREV